MSRKKNQNNKGSGSTETAHSKLRRSGKHARGSSRNAGGKGSPTMAEEARHTERHKGNLEKANLRNNEVSFISAGINPSHGPYQGQLPTKDITSEGHLDAHSDRPIILPTINPEEGEVGEGVLLFTGRTQSNARDLVSAMDTVAVRERTDLSREEGTDCTKMAGSHKEARIRTVDQTLQSDLSELQPQDSYSPATKLVVIGDYHTVQDSFRADHAETVESHSQFRPSNFEQSDAKHQHLSENRANDALRMEFTILFPDIQPQDGSLTIQHLPLSEQESIDTGRSVSNSESLNDKIGIGNVGHHSCASDDSEDLAARDFIAVLDSKEPGNSISEIDDIADADMARKLAKQEELGLGSAEVLLYDGQEDVLEGEAEEREDLDIVFLREQARRFAGLGRQQKGSRKAHTTMPDVDVHIDDYGDFDVLGTNQSSLQPRKKKREVPDFNLSDSELEGKLMLAWEQDRSRKRIHKQHRESLRAQGLLGKNGTVDMKAKYPDGMTRDQITDELKNFLVSDRNTLTFIPLDKEDRRIIHEIANRFNVKSLSRGTGDQRHPCLAKTSRTRPFSEEVFTTLENRFSRRFLSHNEKGKGPQGAAKRIARMPAPYVAYRDGEVVGAAAPELDSTNRGRAMLEKMGWSNGEALGAFNNKGMLVPISHIVKNTRTGLG